MIQTKFTLELTRNGVQKEIYCKAGETEARRMIIALTVNGEVFPLEEGHQCRMYLQGDSDQSPVYYPAEGFLDTEYNLVYFDLPQCSAGGKTLELRITKGAQIIYSPCWRLIVDESIGDDASQQAGGGSVVYEEKLITASETTGPLPSGAESIYLDGSGNTKRTPFVGKVAVLNIDNGIDATVAQAAYNYIVGGYVVFLVNGGLSYPVWLAGYTSANNWEVVYIDNYQSDKTSAVIVSDAGTTTHDYLKITVEEFYMLVNYFAGKQDKLTFDNVPTMDSSNPVKSGGVYQALAGKQNTLTFDNAPTESSDNPVKSGGVYSAIAGKQNTLTAGENITIANDTISAAGYTLPVSTPTTLGGVKIDGTSLTTDASGVLHSKLIQIVDSSTSKSKYTPAEILSMWNEGYGFKLNQYTVVAVGVDSILSPTEAELILLTPLPKTRKAIVSADKSYVVGSAAADFSEVNFTTELNTKLSGIESGAEVNDVTDVQDKSGNSLVTNKIAKIQTVPTPTSADANKAIVVDSNGAYVLGTVGGGGTASDITYDNTSSGLTATDVQDAIDELAGNIPQGVLVGSTDTSAQDYVAPSEVIEAINGGREVIISVPNVSIDELPTTASFVSWDTFAQDYEGVTVNAVNSSVYIESGVHKYIISLSGAYAEGLGDMWNAVSVAEIATKADLTNFQDKSNLVTYLSSACTDTQYPSAKVVYDTISNLPAMPSGTNNGDILVWNGSMWVAKAPSRLPNGFTEVEYIQSSGTQWIDTEYAPSTDFEVIMECEMPPVTAESDYSMFGSFDGIGNTCYIFGGYNAKYHAEYGSTAAHFFSATGYSGKTTIDYHNGLISISDGIITDTADLSSNAHSSSSYSFLVFAAYNRGIPSPFIQGKSSFKLYSLKIKNGNALVRDFVPCYNSDGVIGLFDTVNFKFYTNAGTGTFTKGADV